MLMETAKGTSAWRTFSGATWKQQIDVRDFIVDNVTPYTGGPEFLAKPTARTRAVWEKLQPYFREEAKKGCSTSTPRSPPSLTSHGPGYIDRDNEVIVGLQTDKPFRRAIMPAGGFAWSSRGLKSTGHEVDPAVRDAFTKYRKTHNDGGLRPVHAGDPRLPALPHHHRACPTPTVAAGSSATIAGSRSTASTA